MFVSVTSVEWTPLFRGHLAWSWGYPPMEDPLYYVCISYLCWMGTAIQGTLGLALRLSPDLLLLWRIHCIMFVSVTSVEGTPLFRGHLASSWVCLLKGHLFTGHLSVLVPSVSPEWRLHCTMNGPFPCSPRPLYQNQVKCSAFDMEMIFILMQIKLFTWKVVHLVSFWKWGVLELGSGQFVGKRKIGMLCEEWSWLIAWWGSC